tara:strand:- start:184 stop:2652 length:2469 start_codon:yes stop_codon:yes gene_type:complete
MNNINYIESKGFRIKGTYIYKANKLSKVIGKLNESNFFLFSENVYPFKQGVNYFDNTTLTDGKRYQQYIEKEKENEQGEFSSNFNKYTDTTKRNSIFLNYLTEQTKTFLSKTPINYFDIRGVANGYLENAVCFPFFDYDGNFKTAQIIRYNENGKRVKEGFNTNWFHSYKPIKKDLGLSQEDKYSVKMDSFFGENYLKGSTNIVGIVEAPKTAVILKEIYPNIDWIATAGQSNLRSKNLNLLQDKKVVMFPDASGNWNNEKNESFYHVPSRNIQKPSSVWQDVAGEYGFNTCDILDEFGAREGSDIADYIFDTDFEGFSQLHEYLFSLNDGNFNFDFNAGALEFQFKRIADDVQYFTAVPYFCDGEGVLMQTDNSEKYSVIFKGKHFNIYDDKYTILNAQIDWHKQDTKNYEGKLVGFDETNFKFHLQKCFRILKKLNPDNYLSIFQKTLNSLNRNSNFNFSSRYVKCVLVPIWDNWTDDLSRFFKYRDWKYTFGKQVTRAEFGAFLNDDKFRSKLNMRLLSFTDVIKENRFIDYGTDLGLCSKAGSRGYSEILALVKQYNEEVIGAKTYKTWLNKIDFFNKLDECTKNYPPHISELYIVGKKMYNDISILKMSEISGVTNRSTIKRYLTFKPNRDTANVVKNQINFLLFNITDIEPTRLEYNGKKRIIGFKHIEPINEQSFLYDHRSNWINSFGTSPETNTKKDAEVLLRYTRARLKKESLPAEVMKQELDYLNILIKHQQDLKTIKSTPYVAYSGEMESKALLERQIADIKSRIQDKDEVKRLIAFAESYHKKRIKVLKLPDFVNLGVNTDNEFKEVVNF